MNPSNLTDANQEQQNQRNQQQTQQYYDPSQVQGYDQSYYAYYHQYDQQQYNSTQQQNSYQYSSDFTNIYYQQPQNHESTSIHPPGVPIPQENLTHLTAPVYAQTHLQNHHNAYYSHGIVEQQQQQQQQWQGNAGVYGQAQMQNFGFGQSPYRGGARRGGKLYRGGRGVHNGVHGRGPGQSSGQYGTSNVPAPLIQGQGPAQLWPPPRMAWCELCRVDCNTLEILEQHKNGKKHKKNLQVHEELQNLNKVITGMQSQVTPISVSNPESIQPERVEGSGEEQAGLENLHTGMSAAGPTNEAERNPTMDQSDIPDRGFKRSMRGGQGGKRMRTSVGSRRPVKPPKPKQVIPLICELCNVKCESQVVFESHLTGKKHLSNLKRFNGYQAILGAAVLQTLCQANANIASASVIPQVLSQGFLSHPQPYSFPQVLAPVPVTLSEPVIELAPDTLPSTAVTSTPIPVSETDDQQVFQLHGSQAITEAGNENSVTLDKAADIEDPSTMNDGVKTVKLTSEIERNEATSFKDTSDMAPSEPPVNGADQVPSAAATGKASTSAGNEVAF